MTLCIGSFHHKHAAPLAGCVRFLRGLKSWAVYTIARGIVTPRKPGAGGSHQRKLTPDRLSQMIIRIFEDPRALARRAQAAHALAVPHAAKNLADAVERLMEAA